jgi:hypothetical protein
MPNLGYSELLILLGVLVALFGATKLPQISAWLSELWPEGAGARRRRWRGWTMSDWLLVVSVVVLAGVAAGLYANSGQTHVAWPR